jgi:tellurite resistance protein TerC
MHLLSTAGSLIGRPPLLAAEGGDGSFVELDVYAWQWLVLLGLIMALLLVDLLVVHREAHVISTKEAGIESAVWISIGVAFSGVILWWFGSQATGEYITAYLVEKSLSVDNVFVWALLMASFKVPAKYQHRVLFWGIFGALVMRAIFIFAGVALIERIGWILYIFGGFLIFTGGRMLATGDAHSDPTEGRFYRFVNRVVPTTDKMDGQKLFTRINGRRLATPLFVVLLLIEFTDLVFALDSVPAVFGYSREPFIVFASNAFAILGLRALYFLLADMHARFKYLQIGLAVLLIVIGFKMILAQGWGIHLNPWVSLGIIALILGVSITASLLSTETPAEHAMHDIDYDDAAAQAVAPPAVDIDDDSHTS